MAQLRDNQVIIQFASNISGEAQAKAMLSMEKQLRTITGLEIEVFQLLPAAEAKNGRK